MDKNCHVEPLQKTYSARQLQDADRAVLSIGGMGCENCARRVRNGLLSLDGVYAANVHLNLALAEVFYDRARLSTHALEEAVRSAGDDGHHEDHARLIAAE